MQQQAAVAEAELRLLEVNRNMAEALRAGDVEAFRRGAFENQFYKPLSQSALEYAAQGITSLYEVMRVSAQVENETELKN